MTNIQQAILSVLGDRKMTERDILANTGFAYYIIHSSLLTMHRKGSVRRFGKPGTISTYRAAA
jgi:hypothetical protein